MQLSSDLGGTLHESLVNLGNSKCNRHMTEAVPCFETRMDRQVLLIYIYIFH